MEGLAYKYLLLLLLCGLITRRLPIPLLVVFQRKT
jgi:hypothetical protein